MNPLIQIELERSDGIFYAGEVVRGTVTVKWPGQRCKGAFLSFKGFSRVHWHTGSGDNRSDYEGKSMYQQQRLTLFGNYYNTGVLDEVGENAYFDRVANSGVIHIPCDLSEENEFQLIARVNDYDWGKRDDLLGEILLDVPQLVNSKTQQTYALMRNGRDEKGYVTLSARFLPYDVVFPAKSRSGVNVSAVVKKPLCLVLRVHEALGLRKADFFGKNDVYVQVYRPMQVITNMNESLPKPDKLLSMPNEELIMPFAFQLRLDSPGSAEFPGVGDQCHVRYALRAYIRTNRWKDPSVKRILQVIPNRPLPKLSLLAPAQVELMDQPVYDCSYCGCKCCKLSGLVSTKLHLERLAYAPGEKIHMTGEVLNDTDKPLLCHVVLTLRVLMRNSTGRQYIQDYPFELFQSTVPPSRLTKLSELVGIGDVHIPNVFPSFDGAIPTPHSKCFYPCLKWSYMIELYVGGRTGTCCGMTAVSSRVPMLICSAAPYRQKIEEAQNLPPITLTDPFLFLETYAVTNLQAIDTGPTITGPEVGGNIVVTDQAGMVNTYEAQEDNYNVDTGLLNYQPMVNTFSEVPERNEFKGESTNNEALTTLLKDLDDSFERQSTVRKWAKEFPTQAQNLSPDDFRRILDKVSFSLDKNAVVGELLAVFEATGKLKCAHIVATMESCPFQKADVAKLMAPYVSDPESKSIVLDQIDFLFEREEVCSRFVDNNVI